MFFFTTTFPVAWVGAGAVFSLPVDRFFSGGELSGVGVPFSFLGVLECFYLFVPDHGSLRRKGASCRHAIVQDKLV